MTFSGILLENLRLKYDSENTIVAFSDNAKIHKAQIIKEYSSQNKIISVYLPPYSPQLNPIETLWRLLKKKLAGRVFKTIQDLYVSSENILKSFEYKNLSKMRQIFAYVICW